MNIFHIEKLVFKVDHSGSV